MAMKLSSTVTKKRWNNNHNNDNGLLKKLKCPYWCIPNCTVHLRIFQEYRWLLWLFFHLEPESFYLKSNERMKAFLKKEFCGFKNEQYW